MSGFVAAEATKAASADSTQLSARHFLWVSGWRAEPKERNADQAKSDLEGAGQNSKDPSKGKSERCFQLGEHFEGDVAQFDVAPLGFVHQSGERLTWLAAVQRD